MRSSNEIALFQTEDGQVVLPVNVENENAWLNRNEMATLFDRDIKTIGMHIKTHCVRR